MKVIAYLAASLDGYIADSSGGVDWLNSLPNPDQSDYGFSQFFDSIDAMLMGANTFRTVQSFGDWPYTKPVFVLSRSIKQVPEGFEGKIEIVEGDVIRVLKNLESRGYKNIYVDGGTVVQSCLAQNLLDDLIVTHVPLSLGDGIPLFPKSEHSIRYEHQGTEVLGVGLVKSHYRVQKNTDT